MIKIYFFLSILSLFVGSSTLIQIDLLATLSKLAWVALPVILVIMGNRYFKKRDEEKLAQQAMFEKINKKIDDFAEALLAQNAQFQGLMAKMEATTSILSEVHRDVKEHEKIISRLQGMLNER
jgi:hypothetical protein